MINLAIKRLLRRKFVSIVLISALICIFVMVPAGLQNIKIASLAVDNSIEKHGRGSYDILVRPNSSRTQIEKELGMVEENYIGDSKGGISIADWKDIQKDADIEIAAPVASIGYLTGKNFSVELPELKDSTEFTWEFFTSDGLKEYSLGPPKNLMYFKESKPGLVQYLVDMESPGSSAASASMEVMMPPTYYMVAAIDVESEQKMTGIDLSDLNKNFDKEELEHLKSLYGDIPIIKVIQRKDINIPISLKMDVAKHDLDFNEVQKKLGLSTDDEWILQAEMKKVQSVLGEVAKEEPLSTQTYEFDLNPYLNPFNGTALRIDEKFQLTDPINPVIGYIYTMQYFTAEKLKYQSVGERLSVKMVEGGEPPSYKEIETRGHTLFETHDFPYFMNQIGSYSAKEAVHNKLNSSPLGIYSTNEVTTKEGKIILPTTYQVVSLPSQQVD
ncbi:hypothetical protein [Psychrobacillus sp. BL-248-WT-3]|uniref:hypothetical protein n=1 Tax=Psychrobacillus sp. BL-248-WT-3 TaxID=2725306 RepID=UPI00146AFEF8|nr:hypothetical protein [Psychrobacillus sp. BL-248-WT-3]NME06025.1 hypothetical protein [Psychrobacillus sp. BL-248-WT-3]